MVYNAGLNKSSKRVNSQIFSLLRTQNFVPEIVNINKKITIALFIPRPWSSLPFGFQSPIQVTTDKRKAVMSTPTGSVRKARHSLQQFPHTPPTILIAVLI